MCKFVVAFGGSCSSNVAVISGMLLASRVNCDVLRMFLGTSGPILCHCCWPCCVLEGLSRATSRACWLQDGFVRAKLSPRWPMSAPRFAQDAFQMSLVGLFGLILGSSWAILGPLWPLLGGPGGHLEAKLGLGRLDLGVQGGPKLRLQKH